MVETQWVQKISQGAFFFHEPALSRGTKAKRNLVFEGTQFEETSHEFTGAYRIFANSFLP